MHTGYRTKRRIEDQLLRPPPTKETITISYRIGYDIITLSNPPIYREYILDFPLSFKQQFTRQAALGYRYCFDDAYSGFLGFGPGSLYFFNVGVNVRF